MAKRIILIGKAQVLFGDVARMETFVEYMRAGKKVRMKKVWVCKHASFAGNVGKRFYIEGTYKRLSDCYEVSADKITVLS